MSPSVVASPPVPLVGRPRPMPLPSDDVAGGDDGHIEGVPRVSWDDHIGHLRKEWRPGQHCSIITQTGGGKSHLSRALLVACWIRGRVLAIDPTNDDKAFGPPFHHVQRMPSRLQRFRKEPQWFRLTPMGPDAARAVREAMQQIYQEGQWLEDHDEIKRICDPRGSNFGLFAEFDEHMTLARKRNVTVLAATQAPRYVPSCVYDQPTYLYLGYLRDKRARKRLEEISGADTEHVQRIVAQLRWHEFLFIGPGPERPMERMEIVKAPD